MKKQSEILNSSAQVSNIGGIKETSVYFSPGVTVLVGRNATNRTSFLQAVMAALGSENVAIKGDADEAFVELTLGDDTYTRQLIRRSGGISTDGDPYLGDPILADLFAFLLESNEARRAVGAGDDLRELIMRPIDTTAINERIEELTQERKTLERELEKVDERKGKLPKLEEKRTQLKADIEEQKTELEAKEAELESTDTDVQETRAEKSELEDKLENLRSKRSQLDDVRYEIETERESIEALEGERRELEADRDELPDAPSGDVSEIDADISRLRERKQGLETEVNELQNVISFNEEMLADDGTNPTKGLGEETGDVTSQLLPDETVQCWTCGSEVETEQIESTLAQLRELSQTKMSEMDELDEQISERNTEKSELERSQRERERIDRGITEIDREIERSEDSVEQLQSRRDELTEEIEVIESEVETLEEVEYSAVLDLHREANQLEYELGKLETDLERVESDIAEIEARIAERDDVEAQLETVREEITDCRTRIDRIEADAIEEFNEHIDTVLELLDYANLDRIWIEPVERDVREGRRKVTKNIFELHVIRTSDSGAAYEDTVDHLSESEREVTGLVFALAGYLAHEVYEEVPFMLLDSLEAIDSERIATLVDHLSEYTNYLLVALLPEDANALSDKYERVTEI